MLEVLWELLAVSSPWEPPYKKSKTKNHYFGLISNLSSTGQGSSPYLLLADVIHGTLGEGKLDVLHLAGLQQVVAVTTLLLQFGFNGSHLLLQVSHLSVDSGQKAQNEGLGPSTLVDFASQAIVCYSDNSLPDVISFSYCLSLRQEGPGNKTHLSKTMGPSASNGGSLQFTPP